MKAVIMAGGKGTRLQSVAADIPKPMFPILGKPILEYQIESLKKSGITEITLIVGHLKEQIISRFEDGTRDGVSITYIQENEPLGTAGALYYLKGKMDEDFVLLYGDLILDVDFSRFMAFHKKHQSAITLFCHPNAHPYDSDVMVTDGENRIVGILNKKEKRDGAYHNFVNAGAYCVSPSVMNDMQQPCRLDMEKDVVASQIRRAKAYAYRSTEYVKDMGTPDRLAAVTEDIRSGIVSGRNLKQKQKAVFLDRDGTINRYVGYLTKKEQFSLLPNAAQAIARINASSYLAIVITNQPVVARGECSFEELEEIHMTMETQLGEQGAYLDDLFFCPHHPDSGYEGERPELKFDCDCRKPKTGLIDQAVEQYHIDLAESWFVGDSTMDIQTGKNAGTKTVLLKTGIAGSDRKYDVEPDHTAEDLLDAVEYILQEGTDC
ncbi:MAG: HAD-IIIA family hydrolase [Clostridia bacterium]|nr:HAD-IIIA family hydrolase [Clostridia bacterium]